MEVRLQNINITDNQNKKNMNNSSYQPVKAAWTDRPVSASSSKKGSISSYKREVGMVSRQLQVNATLENNRYKTNRNKARANNMKSNTEYKTVEPKADFTLDKSAKTNKDWNRDMVNARPTINIENRNIALNTDRNNLNSENMSINTDKETKTNRVQDFDNARVLNMDKE